MSVFTAKYDLKSLEYFDVKIGDMIPAVTEFVKSIFEF